MNFSNISKLVLKVALYKIVSHSVDGLLKKKHKHQFKIQRHKTYSNVFRVVKKSNHII